MRRIPNLTFTERFVHTAARIRCAEPVERPVRASVEQRGRGIIVHVLAGALFAAAAFTLAAPQSLAAPTCDAISISDPAAGPYEQLQNLSFQSNATGVGLTYSWNFGDAETSIASMPVHAYAAPSAVGYSVSLTVTEGAATAVCPTLVVPVDPIVCPVITSFSATPSTVPAGSGTLLEWTTTNATSASIDQGIGVVGVNSTIATADLTTTTVFTLTASKPGCADTVQTVQVDVVALPTFEAMGGACVDTYPPTAPVITIDSATRHRGTDFFIAGSGTYQDASVSITTTEDETCGPSTFHLRLTGDSTYDISINGATATVNTTSPALVYQSSTPSNPAGMTRTMTVVLRGSGVATTKFSSITGDVTDAAGNRTVATVIPDTLTVDVVAPNCTIDVPTANAVYGSFPIAGGITVSADDVETKGSGILNPVNADQTLIDVTYLLGGATVGTDSVMWNTAPIVGTDRRSFSFDSASTPFDSIRIGLTDIVGNLCSPAATAIQIDSAPPKFIRALPVSRGFIATATDTLTLEFLERDLSPSKNDRVSLCNPTDPPDAGNYRIALFDVTEQAYASFPLKTTLLNPCTGDFPTTALRGDGVSIPTPATAPDGTTGDYFYQFLRLNTADPVDVGHAPNTLTRGHTYQIRMSQTAKITDLAGNEMGPDVYAFTFYNPPDPLRVTERVESALTTPYQPADGVQQGDGVDVARFPKSPTVDYTKINCIDQFVIAPVANTTDLELLQSPYLVKHTLTLVADPSAVLAAAIAPPFRLTSQLPPYFQVADMQCADSDRTQVRYQVYDAGGNTVGPEGYVALAPTLSDTDTASPEQSYGTNVDYPVDPATFNKGEKGRKITIPFTDTELPVAQLPQGIPVGGRIDVTYFTYVTGYE